MAELYLRKVLLDIKPEKGTGVRIEDLRIRFKIEKTNESNPNTCKVEIYNLSDRTRGILEAKNTKMTVQVGYRDTAEAVFIGDVTKVVHKNKNPDFVTTIEIADGGNRYRNARLDKGYPPGVKAADVFRDLGDAFGLPLGSQEGVPDSSYANGLTLSGPARLHLDDLTKKNRLEWSIQDETLQITPEKSPTKDEAILLTSETGLVGHPNKTAKGVEFVSLVQPRLRPGRKVKIESRAVKGIFKVRKVTHEGDSHEGEFYSKCEATA